MLDATNGYALFCFLDDQIQMAQEDTDLRYAPRFIVL